MVRFLLAVLLAVLPTALASFAAPGREATGRAQGGRAAAAWDDFNEFELVGFSGTHLALREFYAPDRGPEGDPVDCGYEGLRGRRVTANRSATQAISVPARGLLLHLLPYSKGQLAGLKGPHDEFVVYRAVRRRPDCGSEASASRETARARKEFEAAGIGLEDPPAMKRVFRRVDLSSCRDPEREEGCVQEGRVTVAGKTLDLKLTVKTSDGRMDLDGEVLAGKKGFRFRLGHSSRNSFTMLPLEIHRSGKRTALLFQFAEVFTSDRRRTPYFLVF